MDDRVSHVMKLVMVSSTMALCAFSSASWAAEPSCASLQPVAAECGANVRVTLANTQAPHADVRFTSHAPAAPEPTPIRAQVVGGVFTFVVPQLPLGDYSIDVETDPDNHCQARFQITPSPTAQLRLYEFQPSGTYAFTRAKWLSEQGTTAVERETTNLQLRGTGFLTDIPSDNRILIDGQEITVDWSAPTTCPPIGAQVQVRRDQGASERHHDHSGNVAQSVLLQDAHPQR